MKQFCFFLVLAGLTVLAGCGGGTSTPADSNGNGTLAGNWQFTLDSPADNSFVGGIEGGFLLQNQNSVNGAAAYSIAVPPSTSAPAPNVMLPPCNSGSAPISGTIDGQKVMLTATAGGQTFTFTGTLSSDGLIMMGTYTSSAGITVNGVACGTAQSGLRWKAALVPPLSGTVAGSFHSTASAPLGNQNFLVTGTLQQGQNIGATSANVTGTLTFQNYSCLGGSSHQTITVNGGISGSSVVLQLFADNGLQIGQIGQSMGLNSQVSPVVFESVAPGGYIVHNSNSGPGTGYSVSTSACNKSAVPYFVDQGNVCLALGADGTGCSEPFTLSPASLSFPKQLVGSTTASQTITLTNSDPAGSTLTGLSLSWNPGRGVGGFSDFNGFPNFVELDTCASPPGSTFSLGPQQSCTVTIFFSPQQSCPVLLPGSLVVPPPAQCPPFSTATAGPAALTGLLTLNTLKSADGNKAFVIPVTGSGLSAVVPTTPQVNFGAEAVGESSAPQTLSFTNQGVFPIQVLGKASLQNTCSTSLKLVTTPYPVQPGDTDGLRVVHGVTLTGSSNGRPLIGYNCDVDPSSNKPNFQLSSDSCTGTLLFPGDICNVGVIYAPQPNTSTASGLDYLLQFNTQQCTGNSAQPDCEIDSGRFPVELTANPQSPLRMVPGAGLDFAVQSHGTSSDPLTITLTNDPADPLQGTVNFQGTNVTGDFTETDNCGAGLAPGGSCTLNVIFAPTTSGFRQGTITINYTVPSQSLLSSQQVQTVHLRGYGT